MGKNGRVAVVFSGTDGHDNLINLKEVLEKDYGIKTEIKDFKNVKDNGPKEFRTFLKELEGKNTLFVCLNVDCGVRCEIDSSCFLKEHIKIPLITLNTKNILNQIGFTAIAVIRAFEKEKTAVAV